MIYQIQLDLCSYVWSALNTVVTSVDESGVPIVLCQASDCGLDKNPSSVGRVNNLFTVFTLWLSDWSLALTKANISLTNRNASLDLLTYWEKVHGMASCVSSCLVSYKEKLDDSSTYLTSVQAALSSSASSLVDTAPSTNLMNEFVSSGSVLKSNLTRYLTGAMTKLELANAYSGWNNDLLNNANALVDNVESNVIDKLTSFVDSQQSMLINTYESLLARLVAIDSYMAKSDSSVGNHSKSLSIWRTPVIGLQYEQV